MSSEQQSIRPAYAAWQTYNDEIVRVVGGLGDQQLALRPASDHWPIWAIVGHMAGSRVYWLCSVLGEAGAAATPFPDPSNSPGWEDDLDHPRSAAELVTAMTTTWAVIDACLERWTLPMLGERFVRDLPNGRQHHSRGQLLLRLVTHEAFHAGEISQTLGIHGLAPIYPWRPDLTEPPEPTPTGGG